MFKRYKFWTGVAAFLPFLITIVSIGYFIFMAFTLFNREVNGDASTEFDSVFFYAILSAVINLAALIFFLVHVVKNRALNENEKIMWVLLVIFASVFIYPVYWYMKIYRVEDSHSNSPSL